MGLAGLCHISYQIELLSHAEWRDLLTIKRTGIYQAIRLSQMFRTRKEMNINKGTYKSLYSV